MALPNFSQGHTVTANEWNAHADGINANTSDISSLQSQAGNQDLYLPSLADDATLYGDMISNNTRVNSWYGEPAGNGFLTVAATICPKDFTASEFRFAVLTTHTGADSFDIGLYHGADVSNIIQVASNSGTNLISSVGVVSLSASLTVSKGDAIAIAFLSQGASTPATVAMTAAGNSTRNIIASGAIYATYLGSQTSLPSTIDTSSSGSTANKQVWFALA